MDAIVNDLLKKENASLVIIEMREGQTKEMAQKVRNLANATFGLVINFIEATDTIHIGIAEDQGVACYTCDITFGDREYKKRIFKMLAQDLLCRKILKLEPLTQIFGRPLRLD